MCVSITSYVNELRTLHIKGVFLQSKLLRASVFTMQTFDTLWAFQTSGITDLVIKLIFLQLQQWERHQQCMIIKNSNAKHTCF